MNGLGPAALPSLERSGGSGNAGTFRGPHPNPEVVAKANRRTLTAGYKQRILAAADAAKQTGQIGALLRREGFYSSFLAIWRKDGATGITLAMSPHKPWGAATRCAPDYSR